MKSETVLREERTRAERDARMEESTRRFVAENFPASLELLKKGFGIRDAFWGLIRSIG